MEPLWPPLIVGGLHLGTAAWARTQRRFDFRVMSASALFLLAIVVHAIYENADFVPLRPLLRTYALQMLLPSLSALALTLAQCAWIPPRRTSPQPPVELASSMEALLRAVGAKVTLQAAS